MGKEKNTLKEVRPSTTRRGTDLPSSRGRASTEEGGRAAAAARSTVVPFPLLSLAQDVSSRRQRSVSMD